MKKIEMGKKYRTRDGKSVRILCVDSNDPVYPVVGLFDGKGQPDTWTEHGNIVVGEERYLDLVEISPYADIPIDTPGWARGSLDHGWRRRHFAGLAEDGRPMAWDDGTTSHTADGARETWDEFTTTKPEGVE